MAKLAAIGIEGRKEMMTKKYCENCGREIIDATNMLTDKIYCDICNAWLDECEEPRRKTKGKQKRQQVNIYRNK